MKTILYVVGGLILAGVAFNILSSQGLINGVGRSGAAAPGFQVSGNIGTHVMNNPSGGRIDYRDLSGTVTNNTGRGCTQTEIVGTMLDQNGAVVAVTKVTHVTTAPGQTASWSTSVPYGAQTNTITQARWAAICNDP